MKVKVFFIFLRVDWRIRIRTSKLRIRMLNPGLKIDLIGVSDNHISNYFLKKCKYTERCKKVHPQKQEAEKFGTKK